MFDVTALGELLIDFTPSGHSESGMKLFEQNPGGAPANMLAAMNKCNCKTAFIGKVGADMHGEFLKSTLANAGICTDGLIIDKNYFTTLAFVALNKKGERSFSFARKPGADTMLSPEDVNLELLRHSKILHVGSLSMTDAPARDATLYALEKAAEYGCIISYDPNYRAPLWPNSEVASKYMRQILPHVKVMKLSDEETELLTGCKDPETAAEKLIEGGISIVAVTLGSKGAYVCTKEGGRVVPGFSCHVVDTTGAGDSFWGGFLSQLLASKKVPADVSLTEAADFARFGNALASLCVEKRGGIPAMPSLEEIQERMKA